MDILSIIMIFVLILALLSCVPWFLPSNENVIVKNIHYYDEKFWGFIFGESWGQT